MRFAGAQDRLLRKECTTLPQSPQCGHREKLVRIKIQQLRDYYTELGEDTTVDYEEDTFRNPELQSKRRPHSTTQEIGGLAFLLVPFTALRKTWTQNSLHGKLVTASSISLLSLTLLTLALAISTFSGRTRHDDIERKGTAVARFQGRIQGWSSIAFLTCGMSLVGYRPCIAFGFSVLENSGG
jgi:hypothetical protein